MDTPKFVRMIDGAQDDSGGSDTDATPAKSDGADAQPDLGYPADTPVAEMKPEEQVAYFKHQSRKWERIAKKAPSDDEIASLRQKAEQLGKLQKEQMSAQEKAVAEARETALKEGENAGASKYLGALVRKSFEAEAYRSGLDGEAIGAFADLVDPQKLLTDEGDMDADKIHTIVSRIGQSSRGNGASSGWSIRGLAEGRKGSSKSGSVAAYQAKYAEKYKH